ncbi:MAG TPA: hypothetical protein VMM92_09395, partial [Thermoanaerobaculia bacterium]|nr:hypothetical protein [Thermoanaerobaculia bacterium]
MSEAATRLGDLKVEVEGAAAALAQDLAEGTTFAGLPVGGAGSDGALFPQALTLSGSDTLTLGSAASLTLGGSAAYQVYALTGAFTDPDGIESPAASGGSDGANGSGGPVWLKHELKATVSVAGSDTGSDGGSGGAGLTVGLDAGSTARLLDYRQHAATDLVAQAVLSEIAQPRLPNRIADLSALGAGDAVAFIVSGTFNFRAGFTYSDLLPATIAALDQALGVAGASAFQVSLGGTVTADLLASDQLRIVFTRGTQLDIAVDLKKSAETSLPVSASFGATAKLVDPAQLATLVESYLVGRLGTPYEDFVRLLQKLAAATDVSQLSPADQELLQAIVTKLNLGDLVSQFNAIKARLEGLPAELTAKLAAELSKQLGLTFSLSYSRVKTSGTLASFEAKAASLAPFLDALLAGDMSGIAGRIAAGDPGFLCKSYLASKQIVQQISFGVGLSLGPWVAQGTTTTTFVESQQENVARQLRLSFDGEATYASQWGDSKESYGFALNAAMAGFAAPPAAQDFTFGAGLHWSWQENLTPPLRDRILDLANLWGVFSVDQNAANAQALAGLLNQPVLAEISLTLGDNAVRWLPIVSPTQLQAAWMAAMAMSLPRVAPLDQTAIQANLDQRLAIYQGVAGWVFQQKSGAELSVVPAYRSAQPPLSADGERALRQVDLPSGTSNDNNLTVFSLDTLWRPERATQNPWHLYQRASGALRRLGDFLKGNASYKVIEQVFKDLASLAGQ